MDEFEDLDYHNFTNFTYDYYEPERSPIIWAILDLLWSLICLVPNVILAYLIVKNALQRFNFYLVILHCTITNLILLILVLYISIRTNVQIYLRIDEVAIFMDATFRIVPVILTTLFVYDSYIKSKVTCLYSVIFIWIFIAVLSITEIICVTARVYDIYYVFPSIALLKLVCVVSLIIKSIVFCVRGSDEETWKLRMIIAAMYSILNFVQWFYSHSVERGLYYPRPILVAIRIVLIVLFYGIGYINLALLVRYDPPIQRHFRQLFGSQIEYFDIKFSRKKSDITPVLKNDQLHTVAING